MAGIGEFFKKEVGGLPVWGWAIVAALGLGVGIFIVKKGVFNSNTATTATTDGGAATTLAGQSGNGTVPTTYNDPIGGQPPPPDTKPGGNTLVVRSSQATTGGAFSEYDKSNAGVPLRSTPGSKVGASIVPFGARVTVNGTAVSGSNNTNTPGGSSSLWYPVSYNGQTGYISTSDIVGIGGGHDREYVSNIFGGY